MENRKEFAQYFQRKTRVDGKQFSYLVDGAPQELQDLIRDIHLKDFGGCLPNDWIYHTIYYAFDELSRDNLENINIDGDWSDHLLIEWFMNPYGGWICEQEREENNSDSLNIIGQISAGQIYAQQRIYNAVNEFIHEETK